MKQFTAFLTSLILVLTLATPMAQACGDLKAQQQTEAAAAAMVSQQSGLVCPSTGKVCPGDRSSLNRQATQPAGRSANVQIIAASQNKIGSSCTAGTQTCNLSSVFAALTIGLFIVLGSVTLASRLKI